MKIHSITLLARFVFILFLSMFGWHSAFASIPINVNAKTVPATMPLQEPPPHPVRVASIPSDHGYTWGIARDNRAYLYLSGYEYIGIYDISDPAQPAYVDSKYFKELLNRPVSAFASDSQHIYLASPSEVYVLDILPNNLSFGRTYSGLEPNLTAITPVGDWLYLLGYHEERGGQRTYTLTALHPTEERNVIPLGTHPDCPAMQADDTTLVLHCAPTTTLYTLTDPAHPDSYATIESQTPTEGCLPLRLASPYLYLKDGVYRTDQNGTLEPIHIIPPTTYPYNTLALWGNYLLRLDTASGPHIASLVDIQEPATATPVGSSFWLQSRGCGEGISNNGDVLYALTEDKFEIWELEFAYYTYLPLTLDLPPFNPEVHEYVGLFQKSFPTQDNTLVVEYRTLRADGTTQSPPLFTGMNFIGWSPDGVEAALLHRTPYTSTVEIYLATIDGTHLRQITQGNFFNFAQWSPDSRYLLLMESADNNRERLFVVDTVTGNLNPIGESAMEFRKAEWSPDSRTLMISHTTTAGSVQGLLFATDGDGSNPRLITDNQQTIYFHGWLSQGEHFLATVGNLEGHLYRFNADGSNPVPLVTENSIRFYAIAPDRQHFVYALPDGEPNSGHYLYLQHINDPTSLQISPSLCLNPYYCEVTNLQWSPSRYLSFETRTTVENPPPDSVGTWLVPLLPTPGIPTAPNSLLPNNGKWLTDRYMVGTAHNEAEQATYPILVDVEQATQTRLRYEPYTSWYPLEWRQLP
jgi:hypothetical protein